MARQRRHFTPDQKVALLRLHLLEKKPISDLCEEHHLSVNLFYLWHKQFFENGAAAFANSLASIQRSWAFNWSASPRQAGS